MRWGMLVLSLVLVVAPAGAQQELSAPVGQERLVVFRPTSAELEVIGWDRDSVRVVSSEAGEIRLELESGAAGVQLHERRVAPDAARVMPRYRLMVPRNVVLRISMQSGEILLRGVEGDIRAGLVNGRIAADTVAGRAHFSTVTGPVRVLGSRGDLQVRSVAGDLVLLDVAGTLRARSTSGDIRIRRSDAGPVEAESYSGVLAVEGPLGGGASSFATHSGPIDLRLPEDAGAILLITTVEGRARVLCGGEPREPRNDQPLQVGTGGHPVEVVTFSGNVRVRCAGAGARAPGPS